jgi:hypothetical protein
LLLLANEPGPQPRIDTSDVTRFYAIYDKARGHPSAAELQSDYIDRGSLGLHDLERDRNVTGATIAAAIARSPMAYERARTCMAALPRVKVRVSAALERLRTLYPQAKFPPITIAVVRTKPVGMTDEHGVRIGLEALCATNYLNPPVEDRFVHVIAHEYGHIQQDPKFADDPSATVLEASLVEGIAEFTSELISGDVANLALAGEARGHEKEIEEKFLAEKDSKDLSDWINNGTNERPGDLGYWVGYRIAKSYYERQRDKRLAIREMFQMTDPEAFLAKSGWRPGIKL